MHATAGPGIPRISRLEGPDILEDARSLCLGTCEVERVMRNEKSEEEREKRKNTKAEKGDQSSHE